MSCLSHTELTKLGGGEEKNKQKTKQNKKTGEIERLPGKLEHEVPAKLMKLHSKQFS